MKKKVIIITFICLLVAIYLFFHISFFFKPIQLGSPSSGFVSLNSKDLGLNMQYPVGWNSAGKLSDGFIFYSSEETSLLSIFAEDVSSNGVDTLAQASDFILRSMVQDKDYSIIDEEYTSINNVPAREMSFFVRENDEVWKFKYAILGPHSGKFYYFLLVSLEGFDTDVVDFNKIIDSVRLN